jgi:4-hydroxy-tetrahydrodipicolinate reductase
MGMEVVAAVNAERDMKIVAAADIGDDLDRLLKETSPLAMVDFTVPDAVLRNIETALSNKVAPIVGTTGLSTDELAHVESLCKSNNTGALIAPNFAIGAILMMRFAKEAARFLPDAEIVEMHHEKKLDSPSGTAAKTAEMIAEGRSGAKPALLPAGAFEKIPGSRGGKGAGDVPVHSIRLQGFVASQMVVFGGLGQTLTIRHDSIDRKSFMPGVVLALRHAQELASNGGRLVYGLENLIWP